MKKFIIKLFAFFLLQCNLYSYEIEFVKEFTHKITPNTLNSTITIKIESDNKIFIEKKLQVYNHYILNNKNVAKELDKHILKPKYKINSANVPKLNSYVGLLVFKIDANDSHTFEKFMHNLIKLRDDRITSISVSNLDWKIKRVSHEDVENSLRTKTIIWAENYVSKLSSKLGKKCSILMINIDEGNYIDKNILFIKPKFKIECK